MLSSAESWVEKEALADMQKELSRKTYRKQFVLAAYSSSLFPEDP